MKLCNGPILFDIGSLGLGPFGSLKLCHHIGTVTGYGDPIDMAKLGGDITSNVPLCVIGVSFLRKCYASKMMGMVVRTARTLLMMTHL